METNLITSGFSYGEIDPKLQARVDFAAYHRGVKTALNILSIPQGGFTRRFGSRYTASISATSASFIELYSFVYDDSAVYCCVFTDNNIAIYLENTLVANVTGTYTVNAVSYTWSAPMVQKLSFTQNGNILIILQENIWPAQLVRSANAANVIAGVDSVNNYITVTTGLITGVIVAGTILPITFTTNNTLPTTVPQILINTLYYARVIDNTHIRVYSTPEDAAADINYYTISAVGAGTSNVIVQNTWTLSGIPFSIMPAYDFGFFPTYSASGFTFTAGATSGTYASPLTLSASGAIFTAAMVGGLFIGNGGIMRIKTFTDSTHVDGYTYEDFLNTSAFPGNEAFLGEPAWSFARGFPRCGTFFQERFFLAGSRSIPNGLWGSGVFAAYDFDDAQALPDNAISFYPSAGSSNFIKALTSSKSLIVHSNTGNYSTPLTSDLPLTPANFSLVEQNKDGISAVVPIFIDNQVVYVDRSNQNLKSMFWDIVQSSYVNTNISLPSAHLVTSPVDMAVFSEPEFTDGYFILVVNRDGSMGIYNSLTEQDIKGWTKSTTSQNLINIITGIDVTSEFIEFTNELPIDNVFPVTFATTGTLPTTVPQIVAGTQYYIRVFGDTKARIYSYENEALEDIDYYIITSSGTGTNSFTVDTANSLAILPPNGYYRRVTAGLNRAWVIAQRVINNSTVFYLEELDFEYPVDCGKAYSNSPATDTLTGLNHLIGQSVQIYADGVVLENETVNNSGNITVETDVTDAIVGLQFNAIMEPLPININMQSGPTLYQKQHIRILYIHYYLTIGATVQTYIIPTQTTQQVHLNQLAIPATGVLQYTLMEGWDAFEYTIQIKQSLPLPMTILGLGYDVEV